MSAAKSFGLRPGDLAPGRPYVERDEREAPWLDRAALDLWHGWVRPALQPLRGEAWRRRAFLARVHAHRRALQGADDATLRARAAALRHPLRTQSFPREAVAECFAVIGEAAMRTLGKRHYDTQLAAGWLLMQGTLVEMATGEGKTFAATLPAVTAALAGLAVHVITVNDYLAARDAEIMGPLYRFFGLKVGAVVHGLPRPERRTLYEGHVVYASNKELAFDYLRDRSALGERASPLHMAAESLQTRRAARADACVLRGLVFAIVDEADSVFIDEARTPLILSATVPGTERRGRCELALAWAHELEPGLHYELETAARRVYLTEAGRERITEHLEALKALGEDDPPFETERAADQAVNRALSALLLYQRDEQYVVVDGKVQIVDEATGRAMPDRAWEQGLHQMIEAKEGLELSGSRETLARITYQRLFRRYLRLAGMSGTATEVAAEIGTTYNLPVERVPLFRPSQRRLLAARCLPTRAAKWQAVVEAVAQVSLEQGRPVLVGTRTVRDSEELSALLAARAIPHSVLNARQDVEEAEIIARAGEPGRVTVATNMAGRGTDILLPEGVRERGGLHVILTEFHDSRRIDRQLFGRAARQGDPGSGQALVSLEDELFTAHAPAGVAWLRRRAGEPGRLALWLLKEYAQWAAERRNRVVRDGSLRQDRRYAQMLAFSGRGE
jgi:preprotein translocase subunit SecA